MLFQRMKYIISQGFERGVVHGNERKERWFVTYQVGPSLVENNI